jgi:sigma-B regulation protein RsbU (phosphoserine phosphatase)
MILLDLMLPDYNGLDILTELKSSEELRSIPVIVLTGSSTGRANLLLSVRGPLISSKTLSSRRGFT